MYVSRSARAKAVQIQIFLSFAQLRRNSNFFRLISDTQHVISFEKLEDAIDIFQLIWGDLGIRRKNSAGKRENKRFLRFFELFLQLQANSKIFIRSLMQKKL